MFRASMLGVLFAGLVVLSGGVVGQEPKKDDKKPEDPKKVDKKDDSPVKFKGTLPANWKKLGLTDTQVQEVYKLQGKYGDESSKLEAKIKELKATREKEEKAVLTPEQKKRLEDILTGKDKDK